jgi:hypothetical protein
MFETADLFLLILRKRIFFDVTRLPFYRSLLSNSLNHTHIQCVTLVLGHEPLRMIKIIRGFDKNCSFHLQGGCGAFWKCYIWQAVGGEFYFMVLISGAEKQSAFSAPCKASKDASHYIYTLKMATLMYE